MSLLHDVPYREISLVRNNDRRYRFSFEDMNTPVAAIFSNMPDGGTQGLSQRQLYDFPDVTTFNFRAKDDVVDIQKTGTWDDIKKQVIIDFAAADTANIERDRNVYFELDAVFPVPADAPVGTEPKRYTILAGYLIIFATKRLNV